MKTTTFFKQAFLGVAAGFMTLALGAQTIITADNNPGSTATHTTVQSAIDAATAGDIIYLQPSSTSYGALTIDKPITIIGRSHSEPGKISSVDRVIPRASNITLKGLSIASFYAQSSDLNSAPTAPPYSGLTIEECEINSTFYLGTNSNVNAATTFDAIVLRGCVIQASIWVWYDTTDVLISNNIFSIAIPFYVYQAATTVIANNIFKWYSNDINLYNYASSTTLLLFNNMFIIHDSSGDFGINFQTGDFNITNNLTYNYGPGTVVLGRSGAGTFLESFTLANTDPQFTNVDPTVSQSFADNSSYNPSTRIEDDLTLQAGSPALTGGGGGSQIGLYNNGFRYNMIGNPNGIPTLDVISYDGAIEKGSNINVTITAKAN